MNYALIAALLSSSGAALAALWYRSQYLLARQDKELLEQQLLQLHEGGMEVQRAWNDQARDLKNRIRTLETDGKLQDSYIDRLVEALKHVDPIQAMAIVKSALDDELSLPGQRDNGLSDTTPVRIPTPGAGRNKKDGI